MGLTSTLRLNGRRVTARRNALRLFRPTVLTRALQTPYVVIPAKAGIHACCGTRSNQLDSRFRGNDEWMVGSFPYIRTHGYVRTINPFLPPEAHPRLFRRLRPALSIPQGQSMSQEQSEYCKVPRFSTTGASAPQQAVAA